MVSEIQKMRKTVGVQMKDQNFNGSDSISFINFLTENERGCDSSRIYEVAAVWLLKEVMSGSTLLL